MLMCKVEFNDSELGYRTLGDLRSVNFNDKELFIEYLTQRLGILTESYITQPISKITFSYIVKNGLATDNRRLLQDLSDKSSTSHRFNNLNLPISMNPADYGDVLVDNYIQTGGQSIHRFIVESGTRSYIIDSLFGGLVNKVRIQGAVDLNWVDTKISEGIFKREIGKSIIYFMGGERVLRKKVLNAKPFRKATVDSVLNSNFITMDIETINVQGKITPYLICGYNGTDYITSYAQIVDGLINQKALFSSFINQLLTFFTKDSNTITIYAHNLSGFDGILLWKYLLNYGKVTPLLFNNKLISIKVTLNVEGYKGKTIVFKDSFLLLPQSLRALCNAFGVKLPKGYFPFKLTNVLYKGVFPKLEYWTGITLSEYESLVKEYTGKVWNFQDEAIKYCKLDCHCLYEILVKFNELIFNEFKVNINHKHSLTLPALAMRIYKSQFMPDNTIYKILGEVESAIRQSYTGGAVEVYIPHNRTSRFLDNVKAFFTTLYYYDVNSLYPFVMAKTLMPVGKPVLFEGDIRHVEPKAYGFFYCKITSPDNLDHPILQRKIKTSEGLRTIAGLGTWMGWICSTEMDNAIKFGYQFEILKGYQFETGKIFEAYIERMYNLRLQYEKGHPMNLIAKLLMNSLYGKFGMRLESTIVEMFDTSSENELSLFNDLLDIYGPTIKDWVKLDNHYVTVRNNLTNYSYNEKEDMYHGQDVNIAIASAITGGARVWMSVIKNSSLFKLYYSDTDSAVIDRPLPSFMVGNELGQFKLEHVITRAVFLAPKVYGLITEKGEEVIKVKGLNKQLLPDLHIQNLEELLFIEASKEFTQEKFLKKVISGDITVSEVAYTLKVTSNKREAIYVDNVFTDTKPFYYDELIKKD
jgi:DNA polymerase type B, organellar and viral